ncbi:type II toxin-antitoxin system VapC family toxin [Sphingomonas sp. Leaf357]|uniref:type II toxin-antitoxin system VapC family toxin n=1 Tax=Sphingomonas sp. Leaf357 TaxID=1736350 RepID=UPI000AA1705D|nr:type II toxin-antitoxin system VapC family toxin [Sphingomonas sp. Leaf357]
MDGEGSLYVSEWCDTEVSSALALKLRTGALSVEKRAEALAMWRGWRDRVLTLSPVASNHFTAAAGFVDQHMLGLRAGDALHLAIAASAGLRIVTLDRTMADAAPALGIPVEQV